MMKKAFYTILLGAAALFVSCSKSNSIKDEQDLGGGFVSGTYWPLAIGNSWKMIDSDGEEQQYLIDKSIVNQGQTYYQFKQFDEGNSMNYPLSIKSENGVYTSFYGAVNSNGVSISAGDIIYLKTNAALGEIWTDEMTLNISGSANGTMKFVHKGKIFEKNSNVMVKGKNYKNVIKIELIQSITNSLTAITQQLTYHIWLADGIGIIYESVDTGDDVSVLEMVSYHVK